MKTQFFLFTVMALLSTAAHATTRVICEPNPHTQHFSSLNQLNADGMWNCQTQFESGKGLCYSGDRKEAMKILKLLSDADVLGDEYRMTKIKAVGSQQISYVIFDGPNEVAHDATVIGACSILN